MHFLAKITIPAEAGNKFVGGKDFSEKMDGLMATLKPETAYFCMADGQRTIIALIDVESSAEFPLRTEPFWHAMNANIEFIPAMTQQEFGKAMPGIKAAIDKWSQSPRAS